jgi:hypothetical protein
MTMETRLVGARNTGFQSLRRAEMFSAVLIVQRVTSPLAAQAACLCSYCRTRASRSANQIRKNLVDVTDRQRVVAGAFDQVKLAVR